jgi:hypothetical protein
VSVYTSFHTAARIPKEAHFQDSTLDQIDPARRSCLNFQFFWVPDASIRAFPHILLHEMRFRSILNQLL